MPVSWHGVVGRCILQFLPDAAAVLRSLSRLIRPGGVLAFHEPTWSPLLLLTAQLLGGDSFFAGWIYDLLCSVRPQMQQHNLSCEALGNFETLRERLDAELVALKSPGACIGLVGAKSRVPPSPTPR